MDQRIFIAGYSGVLAEELARLYVAEGSRVCIALDPDQALSPGSETGAGPSEQQPGGNISRISWNRRSSLSSRSAVFTAIKTHEKIDKAFFIYSPGDENRGFHELSSGYIEETVDRGIKGYLFILRELISYFQKNAGGVLSLIIHDEGSEVQPPIEAGISGSFKALSESLFTFYQNEPVSIIGFQSSTTNAPEYARFIFQSIEEKQVKTAAHWKKFGDKSGFFQSLSSGLRKK